MSQCVAVVECRLLDRAATGLLFTAPTATTDNAVRPSAVANTAATMLMRVDLKRGLKDRFFLSLIFVTTILSTMWSGLL